MDISAEWLQWRHNGRNSVSNHQPHDCLPNRLFRRRSKKTSKLRVTGLCAGNSPGTGEFPHKWPVTRKMFPFDDVIMIIIPGVAIDPCSAVKMMTSWHGDVSGITVLLWGESISNLWNSPHQGSVMQSLNTLLMLSWRSFWTNHRMTSEIRRLKPYITSL